MVGVSEWFMEIVCKTIVEKHRRFESFPPQPAGLNFKSKPFYKKFITVLQFNNNFKKKHK